MFADTMSHDKEISEDVAPANTYFIRGLPRGFTDRRHDLKMWRQSFLKTPTADRNWQKKSDILWQRQYIF